MKVIPYWLRRKLEKKQVTAEELQTLTLADLRQVGIGDRAMLWLLDYWGRVDDLADEQRRQSGIGPDEVLPGVPKSTVRRYRSLVGIWKHFGVRTKKDFDALNISDEAIAQYILGTTAEKKPARKSVAAKKMAVSTDALTEAWEKRVEELSKYYDAPTPNDKAGLRRLAYMEMRVDKIQRKLLELEVGEGDGGEDALVRVQQVKALSEEQVKVSGEIRALEKQLGIDRATRENTDKDDPLVVIREGIQDAKWLLDNEIQVVVHHCPDGKVIPVMWLWHFFPTHPHESFKQTCPNCGEVMVVKCKPRGEAVSAADFEIPDLMEYARNTS